VGEGATEYIDDKKWPMKDDEVLVEYMNIPTTFLKVDVIPKRQIAPYYDNPYKLRAKDKEKDHSTPVKKRDASEMSISHGVADVHTEWNEFAVNEIINVFKKRYTTSQAEKIQSVIMKTANAFLE
jgi:hypothetical protein